MKTPEKSNNQLRIKKLITVSAIFLVACNFLDDTISSASAAAYATEYQPDIGEINQTGTATDAVGIVVQSVLIGSFANLSGFIFDLKQLKVIKKDLPECDHVLSYLLHFLLGLLSLGLYVYTAYDGAVEDLRPDQITNTSLFSPLAEQVSNNITDWLAFFPALGWSASEGWGGFEFFAGQLLRIKLIQWLANGRCRSRVIKPEQSFIENARVSLLFDHSKEEDSEEQLSEKLEKASFVLNAIGFFGLMLQTWSSLFDVFVVAAASLCAQPEQALIGLRFLTGFLSICLAVFFSDYYLREARESWIHPAVSHPVMRLFAALGMGCFFFATSFNRARLFLSEDFSFLYASIMGSANVARYGLYCREQAIESAADRRSHQVSFRAHAARAVRETGVLSATEKQRSKSVVVPMSERSAAIRTGSKSI